MKVKVDYQASQVERKETFDVLEELGFTIREWKAMSEDEKNVALMNIVEHEPPYWSIGDIVEISEESDNEEED